jgi:hypothetical protein
MNRSHIYNTDVLGHTGSCVSVQYELRFPCAHVPESRALVMRTRYDPPVVVRHGNGGDPILQTQSLVSSFKIIKIK